MNQIIKSILHFFAFLIPFTVTIILAFKAIEYFANIKVHAMLQVAPFLALSYGMFTSTFSNAIFGITPAPLWFSILKRICIYITIAFILIAIAVFTTIINKGPHIHIYIAIIAPIIAIIDITQIKLNKKYATC